MCMSIRRALAVWPHMGQVSSLLLLLAPVLSLWDFRILSSRSGDDSLLADFWATLGILEVAILLLCFKSKECLAQLLLLHFFTWLHPIFFTWRRHGRHFFFFQPTQPKREHLLLHSTGSTLDQRERRRIRSACYLCTPTLCVYCF